MKYIRKFLNLLIHGSMYVLDTNILVARKGELDNRIKILRNSSEDFTLLNILRRRKISYRKRLPGNFQL